MSRPAIADDVSAAIAEVLAALFDSGSSEQFAVADCLNTIAENDDEQSTDEHLVMCAEEIREAATRVIDAINPPIEAPRPVPVGDPYHDLIVQATQALTDLEALRGVGSFYACVEPLRAAIAAAELQLTRVSNRGGRLELHLFPDRELSELEDQYLSAAKEDGKDGELEFDDSTVVSMSDDGGAYVLGWYWIYESDLARRPDPNGSEESDAE